MAAFWLFGMALLGFIGYSRKYPIQVSYRGSSCQEVKSHSPRYFLFTDIRAIYPVWGMTKIR
jgi:hypothetical protein